RVRPQRTLEKGYHFKFAALPAALQALTCCALFQSFCTLAVLSISRLAGGNTGKGGEAKFGPSSLTPSTLATALTASGKLRPYRCITSVKPSPPCLSMPRQAKRP
ncbi:MAG: DUF1731 domain-containing protein, partial [Burkholderiales bacterium]|nr:DUF1731 domain-containing protein [Burkholderiales bacterium]